MMTVKIGQELVAQKDYVIEGYSNEDSINVKAGSKAIVTAKGYILHTTGAAKGKIQMLSDEAFKVKGYDLNGIAKIILDRLKYSCEFENTMEDYDLEEEYVLSEIVGELEEIF